MFLNEEQKAILNGEKGETLAKVMKTLVMYGEAFNAEKLVPITSKYNHLVTSFGSGSYFSLLFNCNLQKNRIQGALPQPP